MTPKASKPSLPRIREDLAAFSERDVLVYGSYLTDRFSPRSDIDVAIVSGVQDRQVNRSIWRDALGKAPDRYDIRVLELLPLDIQHEIAMDHAVVFGDPVEISYQLYRIHRLWDDVGRRVEANRFETMRERMELMGDG